MLSNNDSGTKLRKPRSSIFDLFSRPKVERARGFRDAAPAPAPTTAPVPESLLKRGPSTLSKRPPGPSTLNGRTPSTNSRGGRPSSIRKLPLPPSVEPLPLRPPLKSAKSTKSLRSVKSSRTNKDDHATAEKRVVPPFEPPPLFQAYPQSIRHTILEAPRSSHHTVAEVDSQYGDGDHTPAVLDKANVTQTVFQKLKARRRTRLPPPPQKIDRDNLDPTWAQKIYILVTTGYLLQYSGTGCFDRLPEKVLKLGPNSAAFASDAIEGKHWVLQIVQEAKNGYVNQPDARPFLSKVGLQGSNARKMVSTMLLIFGAPEDMDKWMTSIREEIETMNGGPPRKKSDATTTEEEVLAAGNRRYSGIIRQPSIIRNDLAANSPTETNASPPTIIVSSRPSDVTMVNSPTWSSTRSSRQQQQLGLLPVRESIMFENGYGDGVVIGPALNSPSFFERQPSPWLASDFPAALLTKSSCPSNATTTSLGTAAGFPVPSVPAHYAPESADGHRRLSTSSQSSTTVADIEALERTMGPIWQRHSAYAHVNRPLPLRALSEDNLDRNTWRLSNPISPPVAPPSGGMRERPFLLGRNTSMDPIYEGPSSALPSAPSTARARPPPLSPLSINPTSAFRQSLTMSSDNYNINSSMASRARPGAKRNSVFARPLPIATPSRDNSSPSTSSRMSIISSSPTTSIGTKSAGAPSPHQSSPALSPFLLTPSQFYTPPITSIKISDDSETPTMRIPRSRPTSMIRSRPTSLVLTDGTITTWPTPPISPPITNGRRSRPASLLLAHTPVSASAGAPSPHLSSLPSPRLSAFSSSNLDPRTSTTVPIIRPPIRQSMNGSAGVMNQRLANGYLCVFPPPANPPPTRELPLPPMGVVA